MSLAGKDDYPGCWGDASKDWPYIQFPTKEAAEEAYELCVKENVVPYGSYVLLGNHLRLETMQQVAAMHRALKVNERQKGKSK